MISTAVSLSASVALSLDRVMAARACSSTCLTRGSCSLAMAVSSVGNTLASRDLNTAHRRRSAWPDRWTTNVRPPSAPSIAPRNRLLRRTLSRSSGGLPVIGCRWARLSVCRRPLGYNRLTFGAEHQLAVLQSSDDDFGARTAACRKLANARDALVKIVGGEMRDRLVEARRMRRGVAKRDDKDQ